MKHSENVPWELKMMIISMAKSAVVMRKSGGTKEDFLKCCSDIWDCNSGYETEDIDRALAMAMMTQTKEMLESITKDEE